MRHLYQEEITFYYAQKYHAVPVGDINALIDKLNAYFETYDYPQYYLRHLICTDAKVKESFESILNETESLCSKGDNPVTQYMLARLYEYKIDKTYQRKAFDIYQRGTEAGYARSMVSLGESYQWGKCCIENKKRAFELYSMAAKTGYIYAKSKLGEMYYYGEYVTKSFDKAFELFKESYCDGTNVGAVNGLARCFLCADEFGYKKDIEESIRLCKLIAGNIVAMRRLGYIYKWKKKSVYDAIHWYENAAAKADALSAESLAKIYSGDTALTKEVKSYELEKYWKNRQNELELIEKNVGQSATESEYLAKYAEMEANKKEMSKPASCLAVLMCGIIGILIIIFGFSLLGELLTFILSLPVKIFGAIFGGN